MAKGKKGTATAASRSRAAAPPQRAGAKRKQAPGAAGKGGRAAQAGAGKGRRRRRRWAMARDERRARRRGQVLRVLACVAVLGLTGALAWCVGTDEYRPSPIGWVPFVAVLAALVLAGASVLVLRRNVKMAAREHATDCRRTEKVRFSVRFANRCPLFAFRLEPHFFTADAAGRPVTHASTTLALPPFGRYDMDFDAAFEHIGTYQAGLERVVVWDFLRLFSATLPGPPLARIKVVPQLVPVAGMEFAEDAAVETTKAVRTVLSDSADYAAVREYAWGDPMKNVHWKLSARTETLMTKLFETHTNPGVVVMMDFYAPGASTTELMEMFDAVVECGFSVARLAQSRGMDTEVMYQDRTGQPVHRTAWRDEDLPLIVSDMPQMSSEPAQAAEALAMLRQQAASPHAQTNMVMCSANVSAQMTEELRMAKMLHRRPQLIAVVPRGLEGRERDRWLAPLASLDAAGIPYRVVESSKDLSRAGKGVR